VRFAQLLQFIAACAMALAALGAQARSVENASLEKLHFISIDCARVWMVQAVDLHQENAFIYGESVSEPTHYNYFRSYDSRTGRYTQSDPIGLGGGWNKFGYAYQNPLRNTDPRGLAVPVAVAACMANPACVAAAVAATAATAKACMDTYDAVRNWVRNQSSEGGDNPSLLDPKGENHVLGGDATGGGHRPGTGRPGKSEFPSGWSDDRITGEISDVATDPGSSRTPGRGGRTVVNGTRGGVNIDVIIEPNGRIVTGYPTNLPRNPR
jgi:RHS repeat-associated protein